MKNKNVINYEEHSMSTKKTMNEHIAHIRKAHEENRLAVFIGAGFSKCLEGVKYPSWKDIIDDLKESMQDIEETDFLKIAEHYKLEFGEIESKKKVQAHFPEQDKPSELHIALIELYPHYIITPNWEKLFEASLEETSAIYNVIVADEDLARSTLDYKIIKMHGDFEHDNYVFTESDYLNYSYNFPLIEAYIKGILATHTLLFMGYGFGDYDLKLIMTWLKNNSKVSRNKYMLIEQGQYSQYSENYYKGHGIILLPQKTGASETTNDSHDISCQNAKDLDSSTKKYLTQKDYTDFIEKINSRDFDIERFSAAQCLYYALKPLEPFRYILFSQVQSILTNCGVRIIEAGAILHFHNQALTFKYNKERRNVFKVFYDELMDVYSKSQKEEAPIQLSKEQKNVIAILQKAGLVGIYYGDEFRPTSYYPFDATKNPPIENVLNLISFDFSINDIADDNDETVQLLQQSMCLYNLQEYEQAFNVCKKAIKIILKSKEFTYYFIALWNYNAILFELKHNYIPLKELRGDEIPTWKKSYEELPEKNIEEEFNRLPFLMRKEYGETYKIVTMEIINSKFITSHKNLQNVKSNFENIQQGGFRLSNESSTDFFILQNLIFFILEHGILMERFTEYKDICKNYFELALLRKDNNNQGHIELNYIELYSAIKYYKNEDLSKLLQYLYQNILDGKKQFTHNEEIQEWLINEVFKNCSTVYKNANNFDISQVFVNYTCNILTLLKFSHINKEKLLQLIEQLSKTVFSAKNLMQIFPVINNFFTIQYNLYYDKKEKEFPSEQVLNIFKQLLLKFINGNTNAYEQKVLKNNSLSNLTVISATTGYTFIDGKFIEQLINKIKHQKEQIELSRSVLLSLYGICDEACKAIIRDFILAQDVLKNQDLENLYLLEYKLWLVQFEIISLKEGELDAYIAHFSKILDGNSFDNRIMDLDRPLEAIRDSSKNENYLALKDKFDKLYELIKQINERYKGPFGGAFSVI